MSSFITNTLGRELAVTSVCSSFYKNFKKSCVFLKDIWRKFWNDQTDTCVVFRCLFLKFDVETWKVWCWTDWAPWHHWEWVMRSLTCSIAVRMRKYCSSNICSSRLLLSSAANNFVVKRPVNDVVSHWHPSNSWKLTENTSRNLSKFISGGPWPYSGCVTAASTIYSWYLSTKSTNNFCFSCLCNTLRSRAEANRLLPAKSNQPSASLALFLIFHDPIDRSRPFKQKKLQNFARIRLNKTNCIRR